MSISFLGFRISWFCIFWQAQQYKSTWNALLKSRFPLTDTICWFAKINLCQFFETPVRRIKIHANICSCNAVVIHKQCVKSVCIRSFSGSYFPTFGLNTERYGAYLRIESECGKIQTRKTPNTHTFHVVKIIYQVFDLSR